MNINQIIAYIYVITIRAHWDLSKLMLNEQRTVPPTLEQCTIRDPTENTCGVSIILF